jgi:hypothetical protein
MIHPETRIWRWGVIAVGWMLAYITESRKATKGQILRNRQKANNAPELQSYEREDPDQSARVYQHNLIVSAHERYLDQRYICLIVPRNEVNSASLPLESLICFIEHERMKPHLINIHKSEQQPSDDVIEITLPLRTSKQPAFVSPRQRQTKHPSPVQVPASHSRGLLEAFPV